MRARRPHSIATRLTLAVSALTLVVFGVVAALLHIALSVQVWHDHQRELDGKVDIVRHFLYEVGRDQDLERLRYHLDGVLIGHGQLRIWLIAEDGRVLYGGEQRPRTQAAPDGQVRVWREDGLVMEGQVVRLPATALLPASELIVAMDVREHERLLDGFRRTMIWVFSLGLASIVLTSTWAARRALAPLFMLSREAAAVRPADLSVRLSRTDVVELQPLVQSFNEALERVAAAYEHLEAFSANVAHELRTPLATLINATEVMVSRPRSAQELTEMLGSQLGSLRELASMLNDMLFLARADRGENAQATQPLQLAEEAHAVREYFDAALEHAGLDLEVAGSADAMANRALVRRALVNLVGNAIRHTSSGGTITVRLASEGTQARVSVANPGPEIAAALLPRLFERFFRADVARARSSSGHSGLGLAIVKAVAQLHGGSTFATSAHGITEVGFTLPRARQAAGATASADTPVPSSSSAPASTR